jgi:hypothetical protein
VAELVACEKRRLVMFSDAQDSAKPGLEQALPGLDLALTG